MQHKINFNAGPSQMPPEVLHEAAQAVRRYKKTGFSILELPHRSADFGEILEECDALVRKISGIGTDYEVLWLQGGGRMQFCMIPMNFLGQGKTAGYIDSGVWASEAADYARHYGTVQVLASAKEVNYDRLPEWPTIPADLAYLHITTNNTIYGTQYHNDPAVSGVPLIADMSSDIFSAKRDYSRYGMFYAAVQKNLGAAGTAMAVVHKDLLKTAPATLPPMLSYAAHAKERSVLNTANVFGIYVSLLMLRWTADKGIDAIAQENERKAALLYEAIDNSAHFTAHVKAAADRSLMNVCFTAVSPEAEKLFLAQCEQNEITGIKGHRSVGGFRASLYNAVSYAEVKELVDLMNAFDPNAKEETKKRRYLS